MKKALFYLVVFLAVQIICTFAVMIIWSWAEGTGLDETLMTKAPVVIVSSAVYSLVLLVIFLACRWCVVERTYLRSRPYGVLFWVVIAALGTIIPSEWLAGQLDLPDSNAELFQGIMASPWGYLSICIFAPLVEEVVFRGAILRALLQSYRPWIAIVVSALFFAAAHFNLAQMPHALLMGILLGWMYWRTGSIIPGILLHWVNNTVAYVLSNIYPGMNDLTFTQLFGEDQHRILMAIGFSFCLLIPALLQLNLRMKR
ncbi:MAG: CPBP family intramembrane metalloprotease [Prevotella sp.]|nr:CPBP family intramembrane metalloprotease [Prevotella sp.]